MDSEKVVYGAVYLVCVAIFLPLFMAIPAAILFFGWNYGVAPAFHAQPVTFWQMYGIAWVITVIGNAFKASGGTGK